jgi:hypothetical protein
LLGSGKNAVGQLSIGYKFWWNPEKIRRTEDAKLIFLILKTL